MKISKEDFKSMQAKYEKEVQVGKPATNSQGEKTDQTKWMFFDRETLEGLLAKTDKDPKVGGIQFFFTEYTEGTAKKAYPHQKEDYTGALTLVMKAANLKGATSQQLTAEDGEEYYNRGIQCPHTCKPEPIDI